jgi:hypothetical protein
VTFTVVQQDPKDEKWLSHRAIGPLKLGFARLLVARAYRGAHKVDLESRIGNRSYPRPTKIRARDRSPVLLSNLTLARPEPQPSHPSLLQWRAGNRRRRAICRVTDHTGLIRVESTLTRAADYDRHTRKGIVDRRSLVISGPTERIAALRAGRKNGVKQARTSRSGRAGIGAAHNSQRDWKAV